MAYKPLPQHDCLPAHPRRIAKLVSQGWFEHAHVTQLDSANVIAEEITSRGDHQSLIESDASGGWIVMIKAVAR
jgi:hypothetical protein